MTTATETPSSPLAVKIDAAIAHLDRYRAVPVDGGVSLVAPRHPGAESGPRYGLGGPENWAKWSVLNAARPVCPPGVFTTVEDAIMYRESLRGRIEALRDGIE
jgi:hypothetical protein